MVAKVITGKTIRGVLSYNENKVKEGTAAVIGAEGFCDDFSRLTFLDKLNTFVYQTSKNPNVKTNAVHISLNFDCLDRLNDEKLNSIAQAYLVKIGFGEQPYLIYRHFDAAHPHIHLVTTNIRMDGSRIDLHNIGRNQSERARKEIEVEFRLIKAQGKRHEVQMLRPADLSKAFYGKSETKRAISNIVGAVTRSYRFASLPELNAVLNQYNVVADRGREGTIIHSRNGLRYSLIDKKGNPIGVPIKASAIYGKPTLSNLTGQFEVNGFLRDPHKARVKEVVDQYFRHGEKTLNGFFQHMAANSIFPVIRQNEEGRIYGLTFIDNSTKCVFNGSLLGKQYSAKGIIDRLERKPAAGIFKSPGLPVKDGIEAPGSVNAIGQVGEIGVLKELIESKLDYSNTPYELKRKRKRRGRSI